MADIAGILAEILQVGQEANALLRAVLSASEEQKTTIERQAVEQSAARSEARAGGGGGGAGGGGSAGGFFKRNALAVGADLTDPFKTRAETGADFATRASEALVGSEATRGLSNTVGLSSAQRVFGSAEDQTRSYFEKLAAAGVPVTNQQIQSFYADAERRSRSIENVNQQVTASINEMGTQGASGDMMKAAAALTAAAATLGAAGKAFKAAGVMKKVF